MGKNIRSLTSWLLAGAVAALLGSFVPTTHAGLLQIQSNPISFGNVYWGDPANWDSLHIPHYQVDTPGDGTYNRNINFIAVAHDNWYFYVRVNFNQAPPFSGEDFYLWLDTDLKATTGSRNFSGTGSIGSEYVVAGASLIQDPAAWNWIGWVNWASHPTTAGEIARDVIITLNRTTQLAGVTAFNFSYQLFNSTDNATGDWYPDSANTLTGDYFQYTTAPKAAPPAAASSEKYGKLISQAAPLAYFRLNETNPLVPDIATNSGRIGAGGNGLYTIGALHPVPGAIVGDSNTATRFSGVDADSGNGAVPVLVPWPEKPLIRELWDNVTSGNLDKRADGTASVGFDSASTWHVNKGRIMKISPWSDIVTSPGPPCNRGKSGGLSADNSDTGGLANVWDTSAWATRQLAAPAQINLAAQGDYWISVRVDNAGDTAMGVGLASAGDGSGQFIGVGAMWDNAGGGAANNSVYLTDGTLGTDSPYTIRANGPAGGINGPGLLVAHLVTSSSGSDTIQATVFKLGDNIPTTPGGILWQTSYSFNSSMTATHLVVWLNGNTTDGNGQLDAIRVTTNFSAMFLGEMNVAGSFSVEAWLRPALEGINNAQSPLQNKDPIDISPNRVGWDFFQRNSSVGYNFRMFNGDARNKVFDITGGAYTVGEWGHLVAVYDAAAASATLYFNGTQVAQSTTPNGTFVPNGSFPLSIGSYADARQNPFVGDMDEVAIYTNALRADQVLAHYQNATNSARAVSYSSLIQSDGAVEYLRLDEPAKNIALNAGTLSTDANGVYSLYTVAGYSGPRAPGGAGFESANAAALFNGVNSYIELGNPPALNFSGPITLEAWVQPSITPAPPGGFGDIIAHGYDAFNTEVALRVDASSGTQQYSIATFYGITLGASAEAPVEDLGTGAWVYLAGTFDGANWNLYRNGVLIASQPDFTGSIMVMHGNWAIGARGRWAHMDVLAPSLDRQFLGAIDEPAIYDRALSPAEVLAHYLVAVSNGPALTLVPSGANGIVTWPVGTLQQADVVDGIYTEVPGATSPYTIPISAGKKFYRLKL